MMRSLKEKWDATKEQRENTIQIPCKITMRTATGWCPAKCKEIALRKPLPEKKKLTDYPSSSALVGEFLTFYFDGVVPSNKNCVDMVLGMATLLYKPGEATIDDLVWGEEFYATKMADAGFNPFIATAASANVKALSAEDEEKLLWTKLYTSAVISRISSRTSELSPAVQHFAAEAAAAYFYPYKTKDSEAFHRAALRSLRNSSTPSASYIELVRVFNYIALTMLRALVKNAGQLTSAFSKVQYAKSLATLVPCELAQKYAPPSKACIDKIVTYISKMDASVESFFATVVYRYSLCTDQEKHLAEIFKFTALSQTAWNGMGILEMVSEISAAYNIPWSKILESTCITQTEFSWSQIRDFFETHQKSDSPDKTARWARVIDDAYFFNFTTSRHKILAALLIESIKDIQQSDGITRAVWATKSADIISHYRGDSIFLRNKFKGFASSTKAPQRSEDQQEENHKNNVRYEDLFDDN